MLKNHVSAMEEGQEILARAMERILQLNLFPIILGGGHEATLGYFQGQRRFRTDKGNPSDIGIINFDAHFDLRPYDKGSSSGSMFHQIADICIDVFSSAFAPGVSATQSIGWDPEVVLPVIKHIIRFSRIIGFDICEISPGSIRMIRRRAWAR